MPHPDPSVLIDAPLSSILEAVAENAGDNVRAERLAGFGAMVLHRVLWLVRAAGRDAIVEERHALARFIASPEGEAVRRRDSDLLAEWKALGSLLAEAGRRSDRPATNSILLADSGRGRAVLEMLAERSDPVPRAEIRQRLGISESHLSHLLKDLGEADLIERLPVGREVHVALGQVGKEVVESAVMPPWLTYLLDILQRPAPGAGDQAVYETELRQRRAPQAAAHRIARALAGVEWLKHEAAKPTARRGQQESMGSRVWRITADVPTAAERQ